MIEGCLGSRSTIVANVGRFLNESTELRYVEKRLCRNLNNERINCDELKDRALEIASLSVRKNDIIAFDPGDISKKYAKKMDKLYSVHDGSRADCSMGYEEFSVEAISWRNKKKFHIPLYQKLSTAKCDDYISQNYQINDAIRKVHEYIGDKGIWTFDRGR